MKQKKYMKLVSLVLAAVMALTILTPLGMGLTIEDRLPDPPIQYEAQKLLASDGETNDYFGCSVAIDDDVVIAGARWDGDNGVSSGSAYIFHYDGLAWVEEQKLLASDGAYNDQFGKSVAIDDDLVVVGAWLDDDNGEDSGSAYVFRYDGSSWVEEAKLLPSDGSEDYKFGKSVGISGNAIIVGAPGMDDWGLLQGKAYIFRYDGLTWIEEQKIMASDGGPGDSFGWEVAIDGNVVVITAIADMYINHYDGSMWIEEQKFSLSFPTSICEVAISDDVFIAGQMQDHVNGVETGAAYIYRYDGLTWIEEQRLFASDGEEHDWFGYSVALMGDIAIIGAVNGGHPPGISQGSAYLFRYNGSTWVEEKKLMASDAAPGDWFGVAVALWNNVVIIGSHYDTNENGYRAGSAYIFNLAVPGDINGDGIVNVDDLLLVLAAWGPNPGHPADLNGDGVVNVEDLLIVLANWS